MIERLFLTLLLLLGAICAVTDIPDDYLDDLLSDMNKEVREMMTGSEFVGYTNVSYSRVYSKQTAPDIMEIGMRCVAFARASKYLAKRYNMSRTSADEVLEKRAALRSDLNADTICIRNISGCDRKSKYRTADGSCNNLHKHAWGMAISAFDRILPPKYEDGFDTFRRSVTGEPLLSPRVISRIVHPDIKNPHKYSSMMIIGFGQALDHDLTSTPSNRNLDCCQNRDNPECMAIDVPIDDDFYGSKGITCLDLSRSVRACGSGPREQMNQNSAFIDGNMIYGSTLEQQQDLRALTGGLLKTDTDNERLLPKDPEGRSCGIPQSGAVCFKAGDGRVNEQPGLTVMHTLFVREHNRIAIGLHAVNPCWNDERLYQETRKIVIAEIQNIAICEFLSIIIGDATMKKYGLNLPCGKRPTTYDSCVNPTTLNEFSTAAYRFAHSLIQSSYDMGKGGSFDLAENFQNTQLIHQNADNVDYILSGMANQSSEGYDSWMTDAVRNHLFQPPGGNSGGDLAAFNIQRGRDHGLPPYNDYLVACGGKRLKSFDDLYHIFQDKDVVNRFRLAYRDVDDIDLWPAGISERPVKKYKGIVGPTFACIIAKHFRRILYGDRFFFTHAKQAGSFTAKQRANIRRRTLGSIMCDNSAPIVKYVRANSFLTTGRLISCDDTPKLNFKYWAKKSKHRNCT